MHRKAFSMIELITVIAIILIMTSVLLVSISDKRKEKELETAAREVSAAIKEAQNNALTGKGATPDCTKYIFSYGPGVGYGFEINNDAGTCATSTPVQYTLKNGVTFNNGATETVEFSIPFAIPTVSAVPPEINVCKGGDCYKVCIGQGGSIDEVKGTESCP